MDWHQIAIPASPDTLDDICARLTALGFDSFQVEDERDITAFAAQQSPHWDYIDESLTEYYKGVCRVLVYVPATPAGMDSMSALQAEFANIFSQILAQSSWEESWKQYYKPTPIGKKLLIQPSWEPVYNPESRAVFYNNPGMSFGTGLHATTRICLRLLEEHLQNGQTVLDLGCGSGILSICGLTLGASKALAVDIDPLAADIARENAARNGFTESYTVLAGDVLTDPSLGSKIPGGWDVVCSNIVADVILALSGFVRERLASGGVWIVSGLIDTRLQEVRDGLASDGWRESDCQTEDGWGGLLLVR